MILLALLAAVAACWPSFVSLHQLWTDWQLTTFTHGYLIVAIVGWLLWRDRKALQGLSAPGPWPMVLPLMATAFLWLFAVQASVQFVEFALLPLVLWAAVLAACGWPVALRVAFPIGLLLIATPLPNALNPVFQWASVYAVRFALRLCGIPAYFDANHVQIPEGTFEIAGGCSGLHFAIVGTAIALLIGELRGDRWRGRLMLAALGLALSMMANWVRIFVIILAGHFTHMQHYFVTRSHYGFGWAVFAVMMAIFFLLERRIPVAERPARTQPANSLKSRFAVTPLLPVLATLALLVGWRLAASRPATTDLQPSPVPSGWVGTVVTNSEWMPRFEGIDAQRLQLLSRNGTTGYKYLGLYRSQRQGKELDGYDNDPLGGLKSSREVDSLNSPGAPEVLQARDSSGRNSLVAVAYRVADRRFASAWKAQLWYATLSLLHLRSPASIVEVLRVDCEANCSSAAEALQELWKQPT